MKQKKSCIHSEKFDETILELMEKKREEAEALKKILRAIEKGPLKSNSKPQKKKR